ncbi:MAG: adenylate kinase [Candidatus Aenigmarchaeota archaeon]|uniref:adenylate kinase n=1 Tax=Candidatus Wunengus californicus TaxID=3367619 RepID=UPI0029EFDBD9|nr:adenylate kinase [Candidatus Aenigmarchaeota archaeon]
MHLIILGPHGAGKGTQSYEISKYYSLPRISTGDIIRENIQKGTELGKKAKRYIDDYKYVPDEIINTAIEEIIDNDPLYKKGFVLDGYPRTIQQTGFFDAFLMKINVALDVIIHLQVNEDELVKRLIKRGKEQKRTDDTAEGIRSRMNEYVTKAAPVVEHYRAGGKLVDINGDQEVDKVFKDIKQVLDKFVK